MKRERIWALLRADHSVAGQVIIAGDRRPSETGDNPDGLAEVEVSRIGDLQHETLNPETGRWRSDKDRKKRAERRHRLREMHRDELADHIVEEVALKLFDRIAQLEARIAALEAKG